MKMYQLALMLLIFSAVVSLYNTLDIFGLQITEAGLHNNSAMREQVEGIFEVDEVNDDVSSGTDIVSNAIDAFTSSKIFAVFDIIWKTIKNLFKLGDIVEDLIGGQVGAAVGTVVSTLTLIVMGWGGAQLIRKVNTKGMD